MDEVKELAEFISDEQHPYEKEPCLACETLAQRLIKAGYQKVEPVGVKTMPPFYGKHGLKERPIIKSKVEPSQSAIDEKDKEIQSLKECLELSQKGCDGCDLKRFENNNAIDEAVRKERERTTQLIKDLTDGGDCSLDHHGYCQAHGWLKKGVCPHFRAKMYLQSLNEVEKPIIKNNVDHTPQYETAIKEAVKKAWEQRAINFTCTNCNHTTMITGLNPLVEDKSLEEKQDP